LTRGRKYQIKTLLGFQAQSQLQEIYGKEGAETLLANPSTRVFFRTDDPGTADWVSRSLGDQEIAREKINFTNQGGLHHRRSRTYTIEVKTERAVIASQISGLRNLHGYIRIYECIAAFTLRYVDRVANSVAFISRNTLGFVPIADLEPYQIIDSDSRQPQPATTPTPAAPRSAPQTIASGGGGAGITTQINPAVDDRDLVPFSPDATGSQQHTILQPGPRSKAATVAETAVGQHELRANIQSLHNRAAQGAQPSATKHNAQRQMLNQRPGVFLTPECSDPPPQRFATPDISGLVNALEAPLTGIASRGTLVQPAGEVAKEVRHQLQDAEQETHGLGV
jgi:hypothetical protein